jgi:hypothetical protein
MHKFNISISALVLTVALTGGASARDMCSVYLARCQDKCIDRGGSSLPTCWDQCSVTYMACSGRGPGGATNKQAPGDSGGKNVGVRPPNTSGNQQPPGGTTTIYRK